LECLRKDWSILSGIAPNSEVEIGKMVYYQQKCTKFRSDSGIIGLFFAEMHQIHKWLRKDWSILSGIAPNSEVEIKKMVYYL
jgi:hypothetical protein